MEGTGRDNLRVPTGGGRAWQVRRDLEGAAATRKRRLSASALGDSRAVGCTDGRPVGEVRQCQPKKGTGRDNLRVPAWRRACLAGPSGPRGRGGDQGAASCRRRRWVTAERSAAQMGGPTERNGKVSVRSSGGGRGELVEGPDRQARLDDGDLEGWSIPSPLPPLHRNPRSGFLELLSCRMEKSHQHLNFSLLHFKNVCAITHSSLPYIGERKRGGAALRAVP